MAQRSAPSVGAVLRARAIESAVRGASDATLADVFATLPEDDRSAAAAAELLRSGPVQAQAAALSRALGAADAADVLRQLDLPVPGPGEPALGLHALLEAVKKAAPRPPQPPPQ